MDRWISAVRARRCPLRCSRRFAPRLCWSPPDPPANSSAGVRDRKVPLGPRWPACDALPGNALVLFIECDIGRKLAVVAVRTQVIGTRHFDSADCRENGFGT